MTLAMLLAVATGCPGGDDSANPTTGATLTPTTVGNTTTDGSDSDDPSTSTAGDAASTGPDEGDTTTGSEDTSGESGSPASPVCGHQCSTAEDCLVEGEDFALDCVEGRCGVACTEDDFCVAASSGWLAFECDGDGDCNGGACVDVGGGMGGCSFTPAQGDCSEAGLEEIQWPGIGGGMVTVCGQPNSRCGQFDGTAVCFLGCTEESCGEMTCGAEGFCECAFDTQCVDVGQGNNCNAQGRCELACQQATDCPESPFDGGTVVCE